MGDGRKIPQPLLESVAGFTAGLASTVVVHPLDLLKTRLQVDRTCSPQLGSSIRLWAYIVHQEGGLSALYRGLGPNLVGNSVSWALYFLLYDKIKSQLYMLHGARGALTYYDYFLASGSAGVLTALCTNPIWVIKTRILSTSSTYTGAYTSIVDGAKRIHHQDGVLGFYRGLIPSLFGVSHGALQFMVYEQMKKLRGSHGSQRELSNMDYLLFSGLSKTFAGSMTYPYQVIRARLQSYDADASYKNARDVVTQTWRREGPSGFYKGLGLNLLRVVPSSCVTFLVYENVKQYLPTLILASLS